METLTIDHIKMEQIRLKTFLEKYEVNQPLSEDLCSMFYEAADEMDYIRFLSLRQKLQIGDNGILLLIK